MNYSNSQMIAPSHKKKKASDHYFIKGNKELN